MLLAAASLRVAVPHEASAIPTRWRCCRIFQKHLLHQSIFTCQGEKNGQGKQLQQPAVLPVNQIKLSLQTGDHKLLMKMKWWFFSFCNKVISDLHLKCSLRNGKRVWWSLSHSASLLLSFLISGTSEVSVLSSLFSCCVCGNSYCYYFHVHFSVRCWFCILVSEQILHVGLKWLSCDDRRGQKAMGVWMSRFHSRHFSEGERARTGCHSFTGPVITAKLVNHPHLLIGPFVSNTRWVWANERVQWDATWAGGQLSSFALRPFEV